MPAAVIIGGGLAGLTAARLLQERGVEFELFEARDRLGGRILTVDAAERASYEGFDLGASWLWPELQPELAYLVDLLGLRFVAQYDEGDMIVQRALREAPQRFPGIRSEPRSMRIAGGTAVLVEALARGLPANCLRLGRQVRCVRLAQDE
ncbi:MAG: FAD-dependent oxidoreductase, partial [Gammaproteobacteria bacterium]|nr:FAD-dependent oxidoreductase [Gammaproteobacteria bacterium]